MLIGPATLARPWLVSLSRFSWTIRLDVQLAAYQPHYYDRARVHCHLLSTPGVPALELM